MTRIRTVFTLLALFCLMALSPGESEIPDGSTIVMPLENRVEAWGRDGGFTPLHYAAYGGYEMVAFHLSWNTR